MEGNLAAFVGARIYASMEGVDAVLHFGVEGKLALLGVESEAKRRRDEAERRREENKRLVTLGDGDFYIERRRCGSELGENTICVWW
ncbi:hypothetical protein VFPPC_16139 [Pochonia chlamydosporia 170]|uniref:Uncharacterized protein n=1 Tax=Pochonia chlamydosporia 170 TaxID=1380566 RepID=A0A179FQ32_METCM|nr:hypothetical protein VFPPC_16139 [Pochonia chlamydosporia 170]OAQ67330.1 hypothetical protein VFPPC_16139 [Pochonia chlamydosporia 170]